MMKKNEIKPAVWGAVGGAVALLIVGFSTGWVVTSGSARDMAEQMTEKAVVASLAPICASKFEREAKADKTLIAALGSVEYWRRDAHMMENGWATFSGTPEPNRVVAEACARLLSATYNLK